MSMHNELLKRTLQTGLPPRPSLSAGAKRSSKDYSPIPWNEYFESQEDVTVPELNATFRVYKSGFTGKEYADTPLLLLLHGGGYSGLSWSLFVKSLHEMIHVKIAAIDMRGHGSTHTDNDEDLSAERLAKDVGLVYQYISSGDEARVVLMGHSMGGAIAVRSSVLTQYFGSALSGLVVIDVVEGTALDSLQGMQSFLRGRPKYFPTLENAIEWSVRSGQTKNVEAARISMPAQLVSRKVSSLSLQPTRSIPFFSDAIREEEEQEEACQQQKNGCKTSSAGKEEDKVADQESEIRYEFRIDLAKTEVYWRGWFEGLSEQFLDSPAPAKLLLLAGIDSLDRALTIGQMQGKFQMQVLPECGHAVHEDVPDKVAEVVATFMIRNHLTMAKPGYEFIKRSFPGC